MTSHNLLAPKSFCSPLSSKITGFGTYDHIASSTVLSSNPLDSYCCWRIRRTVDSYSNFFRTTVHKLLAYAQESDLLSRFVHWSEGDKQN
jgi:hypothetical protein